MNRRAKKLPRPHRKISFVFYTYILVSVALAAAIFTYLRILSDQMELLRAKYELPANAFDAAHATLVQAMALTITAGAALFGMALLVSATIEMRVFGPEIPIRRFIKKMIDGHYGETAGLRKHDEFTGVMTDLNTLSTTLAEKHGAKASSPS